MGAVLVTGAAGFIGSHLCERLIARGESVVGLDNFDPYYDPALKRRNVAGLLKQDDFQLLESDIRDAHTVREAVGAYGVDCVVHLAALAGVRASVPRAIDYVEVNVRGTTSMLEVAHSAGIADFVLVSTSSVYGAAKTVPFVETDPCDRPLAPYPATKRAAEMMAYTYHHLYGLNVNVVRLFNVYGPRCRPDTMPWMLADSVLAGTEIKLFDDGQLRRDWTYIDDIVNGLVRALDNPHGYAIYNLGRGEPLLLADFVGMLEGIAGERASLTPADAPATEPKVTYADVSKARAELGYEPRISVQEGLERFWDWRQAQPDVVR